MAKLIEQITSEVTKAVMAAMGLDMPATTASVERSQNSAERINAYRDQNATPKRRTRKATASKEYAITPRRKNAKDIELRSNDADVYNYLVKHGASTARTIETATGLKRKSVESSLWYLRNHNADGKRVKANHSTALVNSAERE
jgi:hypothetical protein